MKPKTELQHTAVAISAKLKPLTEAQTAWSENACFGDSFALRKSRGKMHCLECGHSWKNELSDLITAVTGDTCPECGKELKLYSENEITAYFAIITAKQGVQVVRMFWIKKSYKVGNPAYTFTSEVMQHYVFPTGKVVTMAKTVQGLSRYYDAWCHDSELEVRECNGGINSSLRYSINAYKILPNRKIIPELKRNGFDGRFYGVTPHKIFSLILSNPKAETLLKSGQKELFRMINESAWRIEKYWPSIKICIRNGYIVKDARTWIDYLSMLSDFGKDIRNAHYICPADLKREHDRYVKKAHEKAKREELADELTKQVQYEKQKSAFFGLSFSDGEITVKVLSHIHEFLEEGKELKHCVFSSKYYNKEESLIMSARVDGKPVETIELSLTDMRILQCMGLRHSITNYHDQIINIVEKNISQIQNIVQNRVSV